MKINLVNLTKLSLSLLFFFHVHAQAYWQKGAWVPGLPPANAAAAATTPSNNTAVIAPTTDTNTAVISPNQNTAVVNPGYNSVNSVNNVNSHPYYRHNNAGVNDPVGMNGAAGINGPMGVNGAAGINGPAGVNGAAGMNGPAGVNGHQPNGRVNGAGFGNKGLRRR